MIDIDILNSYISRGYSPENWQEVLDELGLELIAVPKSEN